MRTLTAPTRRVPSSIRATFTHTCSGTQSLSLMSAPLCPPHTFFVFPTTPGGLPAHHEMHFLGAHEPTAHPSALAKDPLPSTAAPCKFSMGSAEPGHCPRCSAGDNQRIERDGHPARQYILCVCGNPRVLRGNRMPRGGHERVASPPPPPSPSLHLFSQRRQWGSGVHILHSSGTGVQPHHRLGQLGTVRYLNTIA
jgi:hypothetical protein